MISKDAVSKSLRSLFAADPSTGKARIENYLRDVFSDASLTENDKAQLLKDLCDLFDDRESGTAAAVPDQDAVSRFLHGLLGHEISMADVAYEDVLQRAAESFETIFNALNELVRVMNTTLLTGGGADGTIRKIISSHLEGADRLSAIETYIRQIQQTFLISHKAFGNAAVAVVKQMLKEFSPEAIASQTERGLKIGPLRKAELYDVFERKYAQCNEWVLSGRFAEALTREFEKQCTILMKNSAF